jgi:type IV pilus assembly protein PilF
MNLEKNRFVRRDASRHWRRLITMAALLAIFLGGCAKSPEELREASGPYLDRGIKYLQMKDPTGALSELLKAVEINPKDPQIHNALGLAYQLKQMYKESEEHLKKAIKLDPRYSEARNNLGATYMAMQEWDKAIEQYEIITHDVVYRSPDFAYNNLGQAYFKKGAFDKAIENYQKSITLNNAMPVSHHNLGLVFLELGKKKEAVYEFQKAIQIYPDYIDARYWLARTYLRMKLNDFALREFREVIRLKPPRDIEESARHYISLLESGKSESASPPEPAPAMPAPTPSQEKQP